MRSFRLVAERQDNISKLGEIDGWSVWEQMVFSC